MGAATKKSVPAWGCYVSDPDLGWVVDTGVGGTYSFDVTMCQEWPSRQAIRGELEACDLVYSDKYAKEIDDGTFVPVIRSFIAVRVR